MVGRWIVSLAGRCRPLTRPRGMQTPSPRKCGENTIPAILGTVCCRPPMAKNFVASNPKQSICTSPVFVLWEEKGTVQTSTTWGAGLEDVVCPYNWGLLSNAENETNDKCSNVGHLKTCSVEEATCKRLHITWLPFQEVSRRDKVCRNRKQIRHCLGMGLGTDCG